MAENGVSSGNGKNGRSLNLGDVLHLLEIAVLLVSIGISYQKFQEAADQVRVHTEALSRVEHYLSSKDPNYWKLSKENQ